MDRSVSQACTALWDGRYVSRHRNSCWLTILQIGAATSHPALIRVRSLLPEACEPSIFNDAHEATLMLSDKETRFLEAGMLLAVPFCVAVTALIAVSALAF